MKATASLLIIALLVLTGVVYSQNPYQSIGKEVKVLTLSGGKFKEFHPNDSLRRVGSVIVNVRTKEVFQFIEQDTLYSEAALDPTVISRWLSLDPLMTKYPSISPYSFTKNNPIYWIDAEGKEPIKPLVGSVTTFIKVLDNTPSGIGGSTGADAAQAMLRLGNTEWDNKQMRPLPTTTPYFNNREGRYIYTEKGGWIDMVHFLFYAGKAYEYKRQKEAAQAMLKEKDLSPSDRAHAERRAMISPVSEALQDGYMQEMTDRFAAPYSAYSYEDLPSDKFGADFATNYFDPTSKQTFSEQLANYLAVQLGATAPENAPNFENLPSSEPTDKPTRTNHTSTPVYTTEKP